MCREVGAKSPTRLHRGRPQDCLQELELERSQAPIAASSSPEWSAPLVRIIPRAPAGGPEQLQQSSMAPAAKRNSAGSCLSHPVASGPDAQLLPVAAGLSESQFQQLLQMLPQVSQQIPRVEPSSASGTNDSAANGQPSGLSDQQFQQFLLMISLLVKLNPPLAALMALGAAGGGDPADPQAQPAAVSSKAPNDRYFNWEAVHIGFALDIILTLYQQRDNEIADWHEPINHPIQTYAVLLMGSAALAALGLMASTASVCHMHLRGLAAIFSRLATIFTTWLMLFALSKPVSYVFGTVFASVISVLLLVIWCVGNPEDTQKGRSIITGLFSRGAASEPMPQQSIWSRMKQFIIRVPHEQSLWSRMKQYIVGVPHEQSLWSRMKQFIIRLPHERTNADPRQDSKVQMANQTTRGRVEGV